MILALFFAHIRPEPPFILFPRMTIRRSVKVAPAIYELGTTSPVKIIGQNLTIDFKGATIQGVPATSEPDQRKGTGIIIEGQNITIKNLHVHGYKIGLLAQNVSGLKLENCDFSYNWKTHLKSTPKREDESDWMSYHQNDHDEWLRYGAGAYLKNCDHFLVSRCRATGGQCGLMLVKSTNGKVLGNNFSYLSGVGLGLYRSSNNLIQQNKIDYCVRGYSYGVYYRGQDSAGILVYEQSNHNTFAYNSVTHSGDGFFLWAGQSTMDTGKGGCNDNLVYGNDFSHSPTNGIEATFSRNTFRNNLVAESWHGIWGGYSYDTVIEGNTFIGDLSGVAIEHGQNNVIKGNAFESNRVDLELWANPETDPSWGYPKHRDTKSHGTEITYNYFDPGLFAPNVDIRNTTDSAWSLSTNKGLVWFKGKHKPASWSPERLRGRNESNWTSGLELVKDISTYSIFAYWNPFDNLSATRFHRPPPPARLKSYPLPFIPKGQPRGRKTIIVDEWGPYDYRSPKLILDNIQNGIRTFRLLGPTKNAHWSVASVENGEVISAKQGALPATIQVKQTGTGAFPFALALSYSGPQITDYRGIVYPAKSRVPVTYSEFVASLDWNVSFYQWDKSTDPRTQPKAFESLLAGQPITSQKMDSISFGGTHTWAPGVPPDYFAIKAEADLNFQAGTYDLQLTSDDGARLFLDGNLIELLDADGQPANSFKYQGATTYHTTLHLDGHPHKLKLEYFQIDGGKALDLAINPHP